MQIAEQRQDIMI